MIVTRAPLRIPFGGGGTDLHSYYSRYGGFILSAAINRYVFISLNRLKVEDTYRIKYSQSEIVTQVDEIKHPLVREALRSLDVPGGIEITSMADVPSGTGLGSSGSFLVALLTGLHACKRDHLPTWALAEEACHIEIEKVGQPAGKHDQYMAAFGGLTCLDIAPNGEVNVAPLKITGHDLDQLRSSLTVYYTGIVRSSFDILKEQSQGAQRDDGQVVESLHRIKEIGQTIKRSLERGDLDRFGELMDEHWQAKKRMSGKISDGRIDHWYEVGRRNGALGGKLMGAGGGGFLMFYCPNGGKADLRRAMAEEGLRELSFDFDLEGAKVLVNF
ncbi:MAG: galactokinase [Bacteroidetes bacterium]|nr:galactokinase [Bacteroidota bacterium]MCL5026929.1 galactokinase [Chloroflexota bacterium]